VGADGPAFLVGKAALGANQDGGRRRRETHCNIGAAILVVATVPAVSSAATRPWHGHTKRQAEVNILHATGVLKRWRVPVLTLALIQYSLHSLNHLIDIGDAHPGWLGPANFVSLVLTTVLLGWMLTRERAPAR